MRDHIPIVFFKLIDKSQRPYPHSQSLRAIPLRRRLDLLPHTRRPGDTFYCPLADPCFRR
jgi:hypothetical protein